MAFDLTGIVDEGFVVLAPGRYTIVTKGEWSATKKDTGNIVLRVPFNVLDRGEFEGAPASYFHTLMLEGDAEKLRQNRVFLSRFLTALGLISSEDQKGSLQVDFEYGNPDDNGNAPVFSLIVNDEKRELGGRVATAVVVVNDKTQSGVSIKSLEPSGNPTQNAPVSAPVNKTAEKSVPTKAKGGFPF